MAITKEEARYQAQKGTIERNFGDGIKGEGIKKFNKAEARVFFGIDEENYNRLTEEQKNTYKNKEIEQVKKLLKENYDLIKEVLRKYCDLAEDYYTLLPLWIIGTHIHDGFNSYPFLFINAMRGSGKSRLLNLISVLSHNGKLIADLREAVLFRTAKGSTICIDEFENIGSKEKGTLRELLNAAYKKGVVVERMRKVTGKDGEKHEVETFDLYTSIAMANIYGMDEILEDRCITLILEKSSDPIKTRLIEDFEGNYTIEKINNNFNTGGVVWCSVVTPENIDKGWNSYLQNHPSNITHTTTLTTLTTLNNTTTPLHYLYKKMFDTGIDGRNIELFYPLFVIADFIGKDILDEIIRIAMEIVKSKKSDQLIESKDVMLIDFISKMHPSVEYSPVVELTLTFKEFVGGIDDDDKWINSKWVGRALKRLKLIQTSRRVARGVEVILDINKAKEKIKLFKIVEEEPEEPKDI